METDWAFSPSRGLLPRFFSSSFSFAYSSHSLSSVASFCRRRRAPVDTIDTPHCSRALATIILSFFRANCVFPRPAAKRVSLSSRCPTAHPRGTRSSLILKSCRIRHEIIIICSFLFGFSVIFHDYCVCGSNSLASRLHFPPKSGSIKP